MVGWKPSQAIDAKNVPYPLAQQLYSINNSRLIYAAP